MVMIHSYKSKSIVMIRIIFLYIIFLYQLGIYNCVCIIKLNKIFPPWLSSMYPCTYRCHQL